MTGAQADLVPLERSAQAAEACGRPSPQPSPRERGEGDPRGAHNSARRLSPHPCAYGTMHASLPATGRGWAHPPSHVAAIGAWKESPDGSRSRRPAATVAAEAPVMEPVCSDRPEGSRCERRCPGNRTRREAKASQRDTNRRTQVPQGNPGTRAGSRPRGRLNRSLPGRMVPAPGLPMRHPRSRRTPGPHGRGRTARAAEGRFQRSRHDQAMLRTDASGGAEMPTMRRMLSCRPERSYEPVPRATSFAGASAALGPGYALRAFRDDRWSKWLPIDQRCASAAGEPSRRVLFQLLQWRPPARETKCGPMSTWMWSMPA